MPKDFEDCVRSGGRLVTKTLKDGKYLHICYDKDGNSYSGEVKTKKKKKTSNSNVKIINDSKVLVDSLLNLKKHFDDNYRS